MKRFLVAISLLLTAACGYAQQNWQMGNPNDRNYDYLKEYGNLKDYVNREKFPNFRLALALGANDYNNNPTWKNMADANFHELVTGNEMKMASCVNNSGTMSFTTVKNFVNNATAAGHQIYGHTLAWHSQQPNGWLLSLMQDHPAQPIPGADTEVSQEFHSIDYRVKSQQNVGWHADYKQYNYSVEFDATNGMKSTVTKKASQNYEVQYWVASGMPIAKGEKCKMIMTIKGSKAGSTYVRIGEWGGGPNTNINFTTEWQDVEWEFTNTYANPGILLQHGSFVGDMYIKQIRFERVVMGKTVTEERRCLAIDANANNASNAGLETFDTQLTIKCGAFSNKDSYKLTALVRADKRATVPTTIGNIPFTDNWKTVTLAGTFNNNGSNIVLPLSVLDENNKFYLDDISLVINGEERIVNGSFTEGDATSFAVKQGTARPKAPAIAETITYLLVPTPTPQTAEEKHDTLVYAMDKWIKGMMEACDGKVKAWDLVNEAISGGDNDGDGIYDLQHYEGYNPNGTWDVGGDAFYWQDFMGDLEYVRQACRLARKYGPADVKLFINDYNLESDWDNNKKVRSLIEWIKRWEADGVTYIDGIGTQMHISCSMNPNTLVSRRKHIRQMFELMAATGKLVRVSELDMGMDDANGKAVSTANMTEEMHKMMAGHYEFIIKTYLEVVPPAQQWSICQWCATDSPANSGWRANTPVGLWTLNTFYRKHTYAGWVRGLQSGADGIDGVEADNQQIDNSSSAVYSLSGQRVGAGYKGIVVKNGKKVMIK